jgi:hypothetical protein
MKRLVLGLFVCFSVVLAGCSSSSSNSSGSNSSNPGDHKGGSGGTEGKMADKLIGKWTLTKMAGVETPPQKGKQAPTIEFMKDGKVHHFAGDGTYKVEGDKLSMTLGKDTQTSKIKSVNADKLIIVDTSMGEMEVEFTKKK